MLISSMYIIVSVRLTVFPQPHTSCVFQRPKYVPASCQSCALPRHAIDFRSKRKVPQSFFASPSAPQRALLAIWMCPWDSMALVPVGSFPMRTAVLNTKV